MEAMQLLNEKLDLLLKKYDQLKIENKNLKDIIAQQTKTISEFNQKHQDMDQQALSKNIGLLDLPDEEKKKMRQQLDNVINEIDKILNRLDG